MSKIRLVAYLVAASLSGCGHPQAPLTPSAPHGGILVKLADGRSVAEVVRRDAPDKPGRTQLFVYYYDADLKPMTPAPTAATLKPKGRGARSVELKPTGDPDPSKAGELASDPFEATGDVSGELSATIGGKPVAAVINLR
jgi:hypothetical protein